MFPNIQEIHVSVAIISVHSAQEIKYPLVQKPEANPASNSNRVNKFSNKAAQKGRTIEGFIEPNVTKLPDNKDLQESNNVAPAPSPLTPKLEAPVAPLLIDPSAPLPSNPQSAKIQRGQTDHLSCSSDRDFCQILPQVYSIPDDNADNDDSQLIQSSRDSHNWSESMDKTPDKICDYSRCSTQVLIPTPLE